MYGYGVRQNYRTKKKISIYRSVAVTVVFSIIHCCPKRCNKIMMILSSNFCPFLLFSEIQSGTFPCFQVGLELQRLGFMVDKSILVSCRIELIPGGGGTTLYVSYLLDHISINMNQRKTEVMFANLA